MALMKEAVALRKEMTSWIDGMKAKTEDERKEARDAMKNEFEAIGKKYSDLRKRARALGEEGAKKFEAILKEMDDMGDTAEDLIPKD